MKTEIKIDEIALETTIALCIQEMEHSQRKYHASTVSLLLRFVAFDLRFYFLIGMLGLLATVVLSYLQHQYASIYLGIYGALLGMSSMYSYGKTRYYHCEELMTPLYLHPGRALLIQNAGIALVDLVFFGIFYGVSLLFHQGFNEQMILFSLIPMFLLQIVLLLVLPKIHHVYTGFALSLLFYAGYYLLYDLVQALLTIEVVYLFLALILGIYGYCIVHTFHQIQAQKGGYHGIINQTCG